MDEQRASEGPGGLPEQEFIDQIRALLEQEQFGSALQLFNNLHPVDQGEVLFDLPPDSQQDLLGRCGLVIAGELWPGAGPRPGHAGEHDRCQADRRGVPLLLRRIGLDPAVSSAVFITTMTEVLGLLFILGLATALADMLT